VKEKSKDSKITLQKVFGLIELAIGIVFIFTVTAIESEEEFVMILLVPLLTLIFVLQGFLNLKKSTFNPIKNRGDLIIVIGIPLIVIMIFAILSYLLLPI